MKKIIFLSIVILFVFLPVALVVGCQQEPAPSPPAPVPAPIPTPTPTPPPEPSPPPTPEVKTEVKKLEVLRMHGWVNGSEYWIEGTVKNIGNVPLYDVEFKVAFFDNDNNLITEISAPLNPSTIEVWDTAYCGVKFQQKLDLIKIYRYRFALPSGEEISVR